MTDDLHSVLEQCLVQIGAGKATIWNCLARYPELASELEPLLLTAEEMWSLPKPTLSSEARARIDVLVFDGVKAVDQRRLEAKQSPTRKRPRSLTLALRWMATALAVLLVIFLSLTVAVDAVEGTLPGSPLHPVKLAAEDTWLWLAPTHEKPRLQLEFARRRLAEVAALTEQGDVDPSIVDAMTAETEAALRGLEGLPPAEAVPLIGEMTALISEQDQTLSGLLDKAQPESQGRVVTALEATASQADRSRSLASALPIPPAVTLQVAASPQRAPEPGGDVLYTVRVTNDSAEKVTLSLLLSDERDDLNGQGTCSVPPGGTELNPDESYECAFTAFVSGNAGDVGTESVTAVALDDEGNEARVSASVEVTLSDNLPAIEVNKAAVPSSVPEPGGLVEFRVQVRNVGLEDVTLSGLEDSTYGDLGGRGTCAMLSAQLVIRPGGTYECAYPAQVSGNAAVNNTNTVTASAMDDEGNVVRSSASTTVSITNVLPLISVVESIDPGSVPEPGGRVEFTVRVVNEGNEWVVLDALVDDIYGDLNGRGNCSAGQGEVTISPGGFYECTYRVKVAGGAGDQKVHTVLAVASDDEGNRARDTDRASVTLSDVLPVISVSKTVSPSSVAEPGGRVLTTVRVRNRGDEQVTLDALFDDVHGDVDGRGTCVFSPGQVTIVPGGFFECSFPSQVTGNAGDTIGGAVTATVSDDEGNRARAAAGAVVTISDVQPAILVRRTPIPRSVPEPGGAVDFTVRVTNQSVEDVDLVSLADNIYGDLTGQGSCFTRPGEVTLAPGDSYACSYRSRVSGNAGDAKTGSVVVVASDDEGNRVRGSASASVGIRDVLPVIAVTKSATPERVPEPGGNVRFAIRVTNQGVEAVTLNTLLNDVEGGLNSQGTCSTGSGSVTIRPGGYYECAYGARVSGNAGDQVANRVQVAASDDEGNRVSSVVSATVAVSDVMPKVGVRLEGTPLSVPESGGNVRFRVRVTNKSVEAVTLDELLDNVLGDLNGRGTCSLPSAGIILDPPVLGSLGESYECTFDTVVAGNARQTQTRMVTAVASDDEKNEVKASASTAVSFTDVLPAIAVSRTPSPEAVPEPGGQVAIAVQVNNTGTEEVALNSLVDDVYGDLNGQGSCSVLQAGIRIKSGESYACSFAAGASGNAGQSITGVVTALASDDEGNMARASASSKVTITDVLPAIGVSKLVEPGRMPEPGGRVTFTVRVGNQGREAFTVVSLVDDVYGNLSGQGTCALPQTGLVIPGGQSYECTFQADIMGNGGATMTNAVVAVAQDDDGNTVQASASATVSIVDVPPAIVVAKTASPDALPEPGGMVGFTVRVTNAGIEPVTLVSLMDDVYGDLRGQGTCASAASELMVGPGASYECSFQAGVMGNAGESKTTTVTAVASDDDGSQASASASSTVTITDVPPVIVVSNTATPSQVPGSGGAVEFKVAVGNEGVEDVFLSGLVDDLYGDLNGRGSCTVPPGGVTISPKGRYECTFSVDVLGTAGESKISTVTAFARDDEQNQVSATATATVTIVADSAASAGKVGWPCGVSDPGCAEPSLVRLRVGLGVAAHPRHAGVHMASASPISWLVLVPRLKGISPGTA